MDGFFHLNDFETSLYGGQKSLILSPNLARVIVAGDDYLVWSYLGGGSFYFCCEWVMVSPDLEEVTKECMLLSDVIEQDCRLSLVSIPPFVEGFNKDGRVIISSLS